PTPTSSPAPTSAPSAPKPAPTSAPMLAPMSRSTSAPTSVPLAGERGRLDNIGGFGDLFWMVRYRPRVTGAAVAGACTGGNRRATAVRWRAHGAPAGPTRGSLLLPLRYSRCAITRNVQSCRHPSRLFTSAK
ncbi:hypothetical protein ETD83_38775, partial [Actinomadura soli]